MPTFNLDGVLRQQRKNINSVDLNRNLPTKDWTNDVKEEKYYPGKRTLSGSGFAFAIVGTDGSGKTTICNELVANLLQKISIKYIYLLIQKEV